MTEEIEDYKNQLQSVNNELKTQKDKNDVSFEFPVLIFTDKIQKSVLIICILLNWYIWVSFISLFPTNSTPYFILTIKIFSTVTLIVVMAKRKGIYIIC